MMCLKNVFDGIRVSVIRVCISKNLGLRLYLGDPCARGATVPSAGPAGHQLLSGCPVHEQRRTGFTNSPAVRACSRLARGRGRGPSRTPEPSVNRLCPAPVHWALRTGWATCWANSGAWSPLAMPLALLSALCHSPARLPLRAHDARGRDESPRQDAPRTRARSCSSVFGPGTPPVGPLQTIRTTRTNTRFISGRSC